LSIRSYNNKPLLPSLPLLLLQPLLHNCNDLLGYLSVIMVKAFDGSVGIISSGSSSGGESGGSVVEQEVYNHYTSVDCYCELLQLLFTPIHYYCDDNDSSLSGGSGSKNELQQLQLSQQSTAIATTTRLVGVLVSTITKSTITKSCTVITIINTYTYYYNYYNYYTLPLPLPLQLL